jgi:hypothetical protein
VDASEAENQRGALDVREAAEAAVRAIAQHVWKFVFGAFVIALWLITTALSLGSCVYVGSAMVGLI